MLIAPGRFVEQFPYDPWMYYLGEEQVLALRLFTHGWDIWHPVDNPIGHIYNGDQDATIRPVHWSDDPNAERPIPHQIWQRGFLVRDIAPYGQKSSPEHRGTISHE